jgi:hypothetical protein
MGDLHIFVPESLLLHFVDQGHISSRYPAYDQVNANSLETIDHFPDRAIKPVDPGHRDAEPVSIELAYVFVHGFWEKKVEESSSQPPLPLLAKEGN